MKTMVLVETGSPASSFPTGQSAGLLWEVYSIASKVPKDSVLITRLIATYFNFFLPLCLPHSKEQGPWSYVIHFCLPSPCQRTGQSLMF